MGLTYTQVKMKPIPSNGREYVADFLVDTGAMDSVVSAKELDRIGIARRGKKTYELADGRVTELEYGYAEVELMGEATVTRVVFAPDDTEPLLGITALESAAIKINPVTNQLEKMKASLLK